MKFVGITNTEYKVFDPLSGRVYTRSDVEFIEADEKKSTTKTTIEIGSEHNGGNKEYEDDSNHEDTDTSGKKHKEEGENEEQEDIKQNRLKEGYYQS